MSQRRGRKNAPPPPMFLSQLRMPLSVWQANQARSGTAFFASDALSVADLKAAYTMQAFSSGSLDHFPKDCIDAFPALLAHSATVGKILADAGVSGL